MTRHPKYVMPQVAIPLPDLHEWCEMGRRASHHFPIYECPSGSTEERAAWRFGFRCARPTCSGCARIGGEA